ncbi:MAG: thiamine-binding protein, partial [Leuconostoc citreum]
MVQINASIAVQVLPMTSDKSDVIRIVDHVIDYINDTRIA